MSTNKPWIKTMRVALPGLLAVAAVAGAGCQSSGQQAAGVQGAAEVKTAPNNSWISVSGNVVQTAPDAFTLDYGEGTIRVEMDDWDWIPDGHKILLNDDVVVYGYVDDDFLEQRTIEASSVYVKDLQTQFFASGADEEDFQTVTVIDFDPRVEVRGRVESVTGQAFKLKTASGVIEVDTTTMGYDPLDDEGFQKITPGDRVRVVGTLDEELFAEQELMADTILTISSEDKES